MNSKSIITRFPPSPTGLLQAGNARTAVFNFLFTRKHGGKFIVRIEDTDRERSKREYEANILDTLEWLGFPYDAFYRQSEHAPRHKQVLEDMIDRGLAYVSKETPTEEGQRSEVIRFKNPNILITFTDIVRGEITIDTTDLGDFVIARSIDEPLYHLGVIVDDHDAGVTHVIRGEDHISNTPRQILLLRALGAPQPIYAHLPLVFGQDRMKLSKRRGARAITEYRDAGYLPMAMVNYLALLGWHPEDEQEIFTSVDELAEKFTLERIQKSSGIFDEVKLKWFNHEHLKLLSFDDYTLLLSTFLEKRGQLAPTYLNTLAPELRNRAQTLGEAADLLHSGEFAFMEETIDVPSKELLLKGVKVGEEMVAEYLAHVHTLLDTLDPQAFEMSSMIKDIIFPYATEVGRGNVLWPLRVALSGREKSPDPFTLMHLLGRKRTLARIAAVRQVL